MVIDEGNQVIEFTLATDPEFTPQRLAEYIAKTKELLRDREGSGILLCSEHLPQEAYRELKSAGLGAWCNGMKRLIELNTGDGTDKAHEKGVLKSEWTIMTEQ